jgi:hypothetical protein
MSSINIQSLRDYQGFGQQCLDTKKGRDKKNSPESNKFVSFHKNETNLLDRN